MISKQMKTDAAVYADFHGKDRKYRMGKAKRDAKWKAIAGKLKGKR